MAKSFLNLLMESMGTGLGKIETWLSTEPKAVPTESLLEGYVERVLVREYLPDGLWCCAKCDWAADRASLVFEHVMEQHGAKIYEEAMLTEHARIQLVTVGKESLPKCSRCGHIGTADEMREFNSHLRECALRFRDTKALVCRLEGCGVASSSRDELLVHLEEKHAESEWVRQDYKPADVAQHLKKAKRLMDDLVPLAEWFKAAKPETEWVEGLDAALKKDREKRFGQTPDGWMLAKNIPAPPPEPKAARKTVRPPRGAGKTSKAPSEPKAPLVVEVGTVSDPGRGFMTWQWEWKLTTYILASSILTIDRFVREEVPQEQFLTRLNDRYETVEKITRYSVAKDPKAKLRIGTRFDSITETDAKGPCLRARPTIEQLASIAKVFPQKEDSLLDEIGLLAQTLIGETHHNTGLAESHWTWLRLLGGMKPGEGGWLDPAAWLEAINKHLSEKGEPTMANLGTSYVSYFLVPFGLIEVSKKRPIRYRLTPFGDLCLTM